MKQWKLRPLVLIFIMFSNLFCLVLITVAIYISVTHFFTKQISEAGLTVLYSNQLQLIDRLKDIEGTALSISTHQMMKDVLENPDNIDLYDYIQKQRSVNDWLNNFTFVKPYINSIQIYTDQYIEYERIGQEGNNLILPIAKLPWKEEMSKYMDLDGIWIPSHTDSKLYLKKQVLTYVLKVYNRKGATVGFIAINLNEDSLTQIFFSENISSSPTDRILFVLDSNNRIMTQMSAEMNVQDNNLFHTYLNTINQETGYRHVGIAGQEYLMIYSSKNQVKWRMVEFLKADQLYRDVNTIRNIVLLIGVIVLFLTFPVSSYLSSRIIRPVPYLLKGFKNIESGNFVPSVEKHSIVEFNKLIDGFNMMAVQIQNMIKQIEEENRLKRDLEVRVLQSQINPHFLYNTLDMINWAAAMKGNTEISFMVSKLAKLFRISLSGGSTFIILHEELEHARLYAEIQQTRLPDRFKYIENVSSNLMQCYVPKIILQPFIENSIIHGFSRLREEKAVVSVLAERVDDERFQIMITDNGIGLDAHQGNGMGQGEQKLAVSGTGGYGIKNVRERLELYLGPQCKLNIQNRETGSVEVVITLPILDTLDKLNRMTKLN